MILLMFEPQSTGEAISYVILVWELTRVGLGYVYADGAFLKSSDILSGDEA